MGESRDHEYYAGARGMGTLERHPGVWITAAADEGITEEYLAWFRDRMIPHYTEVQYLVRGLAEFFLCALIFDDDTAFEYRVRWT